MINKIETYKSNESVAGMSYGQWTVSWWKWALSIPAEINPVVDQTGRYASENQPEDVWFLAGIFGEKNVKSKYPVRKCNIPTGVSVLIPIINCEADSIEYPELKTDREILQHVVEQANSIEKKDCLINGELLSPERIISEPNVFDIKIHSDFDRFHNGGGYSRAAADGYYIFLKPLDKGQYTISFEGSCENGTINSGAAYTLEVY